MGKETPPQIHSLYASSDISFGREPLAGSFGSVFMIASSSEINAAFHFLHAVFRSGPIAYCRLVFLRAGLLYLNSFICPLKFLLQGRAICQFQYLDIGSEIAAKFFDIITRRPQRWCSAGEPRETQKQDGQK